VPPLTRSFAACCGVARRAHADTRIAPATLNVVEVRLWIACCPTSTPRRLERRRVGDLPLSLDAATLRRDAPDSTGCCRGEARSVRARLFPVVDPHAFPARHRLGLRRPASRARICRGGRPAPRARLPELARVGDAALRSRSMDGSTCRAIASSRARRASRPSSWILGQPDDWPEHFLTSGFSPRPLHLRGEVQASP